MIGRARLSAVRVAAVLAASAACGAPPRPAAPAPPEQTSPPAAATAPVGARLMNKVWKPIAPAGAPLGAMYIFLPDGVLLQTSCTEVYRLSTWTLESDRLLSITEDTARYQAEFDADGERRLNMRFKLGGEWQPWKSLERAAVPFVCPDLR